MNQIKVRQMQNNKKESQNSPPKKKNKPRLLSIKKLAKLKREKNKKNKNSILKIILSKNIMFLPISKQ